MQTQKRLLGLLGAVVLVAGLIIQVALPNAASAAQITSRSLTLQSGTVDSNADGINDGGSMPSGVVRHFYQFSLPTSGTLGSIKIEYCTTAASVVNGIGCNAPAGLSTTATPATLGASTGAVFTAITNPAANVSVVSRTAANFGGGAVTLRLDGVVNPNTTNQTFFARITSYVSEDATGSPVDSGTVAASTATPIVLTGTMPESLVFCTGATISTTSGVPDCTTATSGAIAFDKLFSPQDTATASSQMAASTNAGSGYAITVNGPTLTSGSNTINAMASTNPNDAPVAPAFGVSQFGMNLVDNSGTSPVPNIGTNVAPAANGTNYRGQPTTNYGTVDTFKYYSGNTVAASDNGGAGGTDAQIFTAAYLVNVPGSQPAGTYTTTLTYICTPTF